MVENLAVSLLHLLEGMRGVKGGDWDIAAIDDAKILFERVYTPDRVIAAPFLFAR